MTSKFLPAEKVQFSDSLPPHWFCSELCFLSLVPYCIKPPNWNQSACILFGLTAARPFSLGCCNVPYDLAVPDSGPPSNVFILQLSLFVFEVSAAESVFVLG